MPAALILTLHPAVFNRDINGLRRSRRLSILHGKPPQNVQLHGRSPSIYPTSGITLPRADDDDPTLIEKMALRGADTEAAAHFFNQRNLSLHDERT